MAAGGWTAAGLLCLVIFGCGDSGERLYLKAEALRKKGELQSALKHYQLLVDTRPTSPWADKALFRKAEILSQSFSQPAPAAEALDQLVADYPGSALAPDALLRIANLQYWELQNYDAARAALERALRDYRERAQIQAAAQMALARIQHAEGKWESVLTCQKILQGLPKESDRCAEAQFLIARSYETLKRDPVRALAEYKKVVERYPKSKWAEESRRALGWIYYYASQTQRPTPAVTKPLPGPPKVFVRVPSVRAAPSESFTPPALIRASQTCLAAAGVQASSAFLMGVSGIAFQFYYDSAHPMAGMEFYPQDPVRRIAKCFGLQPVTVVKTDFQEALLTLKEELRRKRPVLTTFVLPPPQWVAVMGYDEATQRVFIQGLDVKFRAVGVRDMEHSWSTTRCPKLEPEQASRRGYVMCVLSGKPSEQSASRVVPEALLVAVRMMEEGPRGGMAGGLGAYRELLRDVQEAARAPAATREKILWLSQWNTSPLLALQSARRAAARFLREASKDLSGPQHASLLHTAETYERIASGLETLHATLPTPDVLRKTGGEMDEAAFQHAAENLPDSAQQIAKLLELEQTAVQEIKELVAR